MKHNNGHEFITIVTNFDPQLDEASKELIAMIPEGEENAIHMKALADYLNVEERDIRREILNLRNKGVIIASSQQGYFIPSSGTELFRYYRDKRGRALTTLKSLKETRRILRGLGFITDERGGKEQ